jgi:hypothetical protein
VDQELFIDFLCIPSLADTTMLLVLSSAVHGIEGYSGSAVQQMFLKEMVNKDLLNKIRHLRFSEDLRIVAIHIKGDQ